MSKEREYYRKLITEIKERQLAREFLIQHKILDFQKFLDEEDEKKENKRK